MAGYKQQCPFIDDLTYSTWWFFHSYVSYVHLPDIIGASHLQRSDAIERLLRTGHPSCHGPNMGAFWEHLLMVDENGKHLCKWCFHGKTSIIIFINTVRILFIYVNGAIENPWSKWSSSSLFDRHERLVTGRIPLGYPSSKMAIGKFPEAMEVWMGNPRTTWEFQS